MTNILDYPKAEAKKAVILARVSSKEQEDGHSIEAQKHRLQLYCQRRGLEVLRVYEITESSTRGDRKKFMDMIKFCKAQKQTIAIVADKIDRVQRSFTEQPLLDGLIKIGKIELHFNTEGYIIHRDSVSQERLMWSFGIIMAQSYVDSMRDNVKRSFDQKLRIGETVSKAPVGYLNVRTDGRSEVIIDEFRIGFVRRIFEEYATGNYTLPTITKKAKEWGLRMFNGQPMSRAQMYKVITNTFYYGVMTVKGKQYPHRYPPLIDKQLFDTCQAVLQGWNKKPFKYCGKEFIFRGLLTCKVNGKIVSPFVKSKVSKKTGEKKEWTYLRSWNEEGKYIYIREEKILQQAEKAFNGLVMPTEATAALVQYLRTTDNAERDFLLRRTNELKKEDTLIQSRRHSLMDLLIDGAITRDEYDERMVLLREKQLQIAKELGAHRDSDDDFKNAMIFFVDLCNKAPNLFSGATIEQKRAYLNLVLLNLQLDGESLCFSYRMPFAEYVESGKTGKWSQFIDFCRTNLEIRQAILSLHLRFKSINPNT